MASDTSNKCIEYLRAIDRCGYNANGPWAAEPTALAALAFNAYGEHKSVRRLAAQLADKQLSSGNVTANGERDSPSWPTSLAILAWLAAEEPEYEIRVDRAIEWAFNNSGRTANHSPQIGHDPTILGWSWAAETHSWLEPTAMFVVALKAAGLSDHSRTREGVRLVTDRLLPEGGCNFGSTVILGQATLPQVQSTGLAMLALADEDHSDPRVERSLQYLENNLGPETSTASLAYGAIGLTIHRRRPPQAKAWLAHAFEREFSRGPSPYKLALIALASDADLSWLPTRHEGAHA